ncbi:MAG: flagellar motor protein MotB [Melioribacteraceae bacterium]|nr:MAG: flagellar motor protein MotB [Melioribacteraceae bacterium]
MAEQDQDQEQPIIVKKIEGGHGHHGGAWKVAYADFVTAMMALFIVLWVLGQSEEVKEAVSGYFKDPIGFGNQQSRNLIPGPQEGFIDPSMINPQMINEAQAEREALEKMGEEIVAELADKEEFEDLVDQIQVEVTNDGLRIEMIESADDIFFEVGSSSLNNSATTILSKIGTRISDMNNRIVIEGHTDARPFNSRGDLYTNFELSSDRANAARRALLRGGLKDEQIYEIRGLADRMLKDPEDPYSVVNRRISIIVKFQKQK